MLIINLTSSTSTWKENTHGIIKPFETNPPCPMLTKLRKLFSQTETTICSPGTDVEGKISLELKRLS